jgi:hypothetical protein
VVYPLFKTLRPTTRVWNREKISSMFSSSSILSYSYLWTKASTFVSFTSSLPLWVIPNESNIAFAGSLFMIFSY